MKLRSLFLVFTFAFLLNNSIAQNVGIGIDTPQAKLHVNGNFKLKNGVAVNTISADSSFNPGDDSTLPTQKAIKRYIQKGNWLSTPGTSLVPKSQVNAGSSPGSVFVQGNYAYVTSNDGGGRLNVFDVSNPSTITLAGFINIGAGPVAVYVQGNYAYVITTNSRLNIYNVSNPASMVQAGFTTNSISTPVAIQVQGNFAYVACSGNNRLIVFNVSNPAVIIMAGFINLGAPIVSMVVRGNYAYSLVPDNIAVAHKLITCDISNPANIGTTGISDLLQVDGQGGSLYVQGNYLYLSRGYGSQYSLNIYDVSDPSQFVPLGTTTANIQGPSRVFVLGNYAYVISINNNRLSVFDINNPNNIVPKEFTSAYISLPSALYVQGNYVYVTSGNGLSAYYYGPTTAVVSFTESQSLSLVQPLWQAGRDDKTYRDGNVGLGVLDPANKLDVNGGVVIGSAYSGTMAAPADGLLVQGRVGIGTTSPTVPLEVTAITGNISAPYNYMGGSSGFGSYLGSTVTTPISIKAAGRIISTEFDAVSDKRIKRNVRTSSSLNDLQTLLGIRVADYQLKDSIQNGNAAVKGFIAQELETVMPQAVHTNADYVPDIYCLSTSTQYNEKDKTLKISLCKPHELKVGDKVKAFAGDGMQEQYVSAINNETTFTLSNWEIKQAGMNPVEKVFVWGKWVTDFHTVDYNQVFSMGISAIQQLAKENSELKTKTESLQLQIDELRKMILKKSK